jgi:acetylornithine deacetylase/succinyl-diaminopimelate desuccinylase-like protein
MSRPPWAAVVLSTAVCASTGAAESASGRADAARVRAAVEEWRRAHEVEIVREFAALLALPNVASDATNIRRNADHILGLLRRRGLGARLLEVEGSPPAVYGELLTPGARRTVVIYAHYDGQPVTPAQWATPPWTPVLRDGPLEAGGKELPLADLRGPLGAEWRLYARSASDDKAPIVGVLAALDALRAAGVPPTVNLKLFLEGEEEAGSDHIVPMLQAHADTLRADLWILCDGPVHQSRRPQVFYGARGVTDLSITAFGPLRALHSGHYGNWAPNPAVTLAHVLASLRATDGRVVVDGFYDDVRAPTESEQTAVAAVPPVEEEMGRALAVPDVPGRPSLAAGVLQPALNVRGIAAGAVGAQTANAIPTQATLSIDFRLVPDQTPESVRARVEAHLRRQGWVLTHEAPDAARRRAEARLLLLEWGGGGYPPARTSLDDPAAQALVGALEEWLGQPLIQMPTLGGSVPMHRFAEVLRVPIVGLPIANHDNNQHAANENLRLQNLWDGIGLYAAVLTGLGPRLEALPARAERR